VLPDQDEQPRPAMGYTCAPVVVDRFAAQFRNVPGEEGVRTEAEINDPTLIERNKRAPLVKATHSCGPISEFDSPDNKKLSELFFNGTSAFLSFPYRIEIESKRDVTFLKLQNHTE
jgi:hypothetical protein